MTTFSIAGVFCTRKSLKKQATPENALPVGMHAIMLLPSSHHHHHNAIAQVAIIIITVVVGYSYHNGRRRIFEEEEDNGVDHDIIVGIFLVILPFLISLAFLSLSMVMVLPPKPSLSMARASPSLHNPPSLSLLPMDPPAAYFLRRPRSLLPPQQILPHLQAQGIPQLPMPLLQLSLLVLPSMPIYYNYTPSKRSRVLMSMVKILKGALELEHEEQEH
ncbi:hypothetical protein ACLOJK_035100 [Asimina triloba]